MLKKHIGYRTENNEQRKVFFLQPYLEDDTSSTIVIDVNSMPMHYKTQLENFVDTLTAQQTPRLIDYLQHESFNDGTSILQYVHKNNHIERVKASELDLSLDGYAHNTKPYSEILPYILANDGKTGAVSEKAVEEVKAENETSKKEELLVEDFIKPVQKPTQQTTSQVQTQVQSVSNLVTRFEDDKTVTFVLDKASIESVKQLGEAYTELKNKTMEYVETMRKQQVDVYNIVRGGDSEILEAMAAILGVEPMPLRKSLSNLRNIPMEGTEEQKTKRRRPKAEDVSK